MPQHAMRIVNSYFPNVRKVVDATADVMIEVTKRDTTSAKVRNHNECAMAVACKRRFHLDGVIISVKRAYLIKGNKATRFTLPESVSREVVSFDRQGGFDEGKYKLHKPPKGMKLGAKRNDGKQRTGPHKTKLTDKFQHLTEGIRTVLGGSKGEGIRRTHPA